MSLIYAKFNIVNENDIKVFAQNFPRKMLMVEIIIISKNMYIEQNNYSTKIRSAHW